MRTPAWTIPLAQTDDQAETAVLAVLDDPPCIATFISSRKIQLFEANGKALGVGPELAGVGRIFRLAPGFIAAATDRQIGLINLREGTKQKVDLSMVEITHLAIEPLGFGLAIVQERDRIGRATPAGDWIWKQELQTPVEELAIGPAGYSAVTTNDGELMVFGPSGDASISFRTDPSDPPLLIEAPENARPDLCWVTLQRRAQILRGHDLQGRVLWEVPIPWEAWLLQRIGPFALAAAPDGRALAVDGSGTVHAQGGATGQTDEIFAPEGDRQLLRISRRGSHLLCGLLDGRVRWRAVASDPVGPMAAGRIGVAAMIGRSLGFFPAEPGP
jgi:hypothetical protein